MIEYDNREWMRLLVSLRGSVLPRLIPRMIGFTIFAAFLNWLYSAFHWNWTVDSAPWAIVGLALGLLLVFRTNTAYERYWEGRKMWGAVTNATRKAGMNAVTYISSDPPEAGALCLRILRHLAAFSLVMKQHLRHNKNFSEVRDLLDDEEYRTVCTAFNPPLATLTLAQRALFRCHALGALSEHHLALVDQPLNELVGALGACERIRNTPIPLAYVLHLRRSLFIFCTTLPVALIPKFGVWSPIIVMFVSYAFLGIEEIGVEIEDPFGTDPNDLPIEQITGSIGTVMEELGEKKVAGCRLPVASK